MCVYKINILACFFSIACALSELDGLTTGCKENTVQAKEQKLRRYLFDNYDKSNPPCANKTAIELMIYPKSLEFVRLELITGITGILY